MYSLYFIMHSFIVIFYLQGIYCYCLLLNYGIWRADNEAAELKDGEFTSVLIAARWMKLWHAFLLFVSYITPSWTQISHSREFHNITRSLPLHEYMVSPRSAAIIVYYSAHIFPNIYINLLTDLLNIILTLHILVYIPIHII